MFYFCEFFKIQFLFFLNAHFHFCKFLELLIYLICCVCVHLYSSLTIHYCRPVLACCSWFSWIREKFFSRNCSACSSNTTQSVRLITVISLVVFFCFCFVWNMVTRSWWFPTSSTSSFHFRSLTNFLILQILRTRYMGSRWLHQCRSATWSFFEFRISSNWCVNFNWKRNPCPIFAVGKLSVDKASYRW